MAGSNGLNEPMPPPITSGGENGWASRYWDCCKPACGWKGNVRSGNPMTSCNQQNQDLSSFDLDEPSLETDQGMGERPSEHVLNVRRDSIPVVNGFVRCL